MVTGSISSTNMDPELWPNPNKFDPKRFLNAEGSYKKPNRFIPFSVGEFSDYIVDSCPPD
jgi:cytochrome P450 family 2 subfamily U polypeptide 1